MLEVLRSVASSRRFTKGRDGPPNKPTAVAAIRSRRG
jgi:hypothetical protein